MRTPFRYNCCREGDKEQQQKLSRDVTLPEHLLDGTSAINSTTISLSPYFNTNTVVSISIVITALFPVNKRDYRDEEVGGGRVGLVPLRIPFIYSGSKTLITRLTNVANFHSFDICLTGRDGEGNGKGLDFPERRKSSRKWRPMRKEKRGKFDGGEMFHVSGFPIMLIRDFGD